MPHASALRSRALAAITALAGLVSPALRGATDPLSEGFVHPPAAAKPWVYWYFMDGNLTREGMTADLEAMQRAGIGGAIFLEVNIGVPRGPVDFMSPEWQELLAQAVHEAERLGLQIALGSGPGWCGTGGPWVKPEHAMQDLVASETRVTGPISFAGALPPPLPGKPYFGEGTLTPELKREWRQFYRDVAVLAFPTPANGSRIEDVEEKALYRRDPYSSRPGVKPFLPEPPANAAAFRPRGISTAEVVDLTGRLSPDGRLAWEVPPGQWTILRMGRTLTGQTTRPAPEPGLGFETDKFDRTALDEHFDAFVARLLARIGERRGASSAREDAPPQHRSPASSHGAPGGPALPAGRRREAGVTMLHFDSWEMGAQNWSGRFREEFQRRRGYDPLKYLPTFSGLVVDSPAISERFLWDVRQTAQELVVENHVGHLKELAHQNGLRFSLEPYDLNPCADLTLGRVADVPQCEFWYQGFDTTYSVLEAASIAHTGGMSMVAAEAFTAEAGEDWKADPAALKPLGDWAFCAGVNRFDFHRFQAQPRSDRWPGMTMGPYGVHWDRTQTWWDMVPAYHQYLARCQFLLQRGVTVADVCFLAAEGAPHVFRPPSSAVSGKWPDHSGYAFDGCAPETLLERAKVRDGMIGFAGGTRYRVLVLPEVKTMTPALLRKIRSLVRAGATVFGPPPVMSPSLQDYPRCDEEVKALARELWGNCDGRSVFSHRLGQGEVRWRETAVRPGEEYGDFQAVVDGLKQQSIPPDFESPGPVRFTHRREDDTDIYFLANREQQTVTVDASFRTTGRRPECFDPINGEIRPLPEFTVRKGVTTLPLRFEPGQSFFVVFRRPAAGASLTGRNFAPLHPVRTLEGAWEVAFDPRWGGPERVTFSALDDWSRRGEEGIRHYSGKATYRKTFSWSGNPAARKLWLDLGEVRNLARIRLNGRDLGVVWCLPNRVNVTSALQPGPNRLEVEVANGWPNRLIGDQALPPSKRYTATTHNPYQADSPLLPSGLLGPVQLLGEE